MTDRIDYKPGDTAYIVHSALFVREVRVLRVSGDMCTLRFTDSEGGVRLRASRLYRTKEEAEAAMEKKKEALRKLSGTNRKSTAAALNEMSRGPTTGPGSSTGSMTGRSIKSYSGGSAEYCFSSLGSAFI